MDFDIFDNDFIRPLVTLILPGLVAIHSFLLFFAFNQYGNADNAIDNFRGEIFTALTAPDTGLSLTTVTAIVFVLLIVSLIVGVILEDLGSRIEILCRKIVKANIYKQNIALILLERCALFLFWKVRNGKNEKWKRVSNFFKLIIALLLTIIAIITFCYIHKLSTDLNPNYEQYIRLLFLFVIIICPLMNLLVSLLNNSDFPAKVSSWSQKQINSINKSLAQQEWNEFWNKTIIQDKNKNEILSKLKTLDDEQFYETQEVFRDHLFQQLYKQPKASQKRDKNIIERQFERDWEKYLKLKEGEETVGVGYIRYIVLRMKFELSMVWSCFISGLNYYFIFHAGKSNFVETVPFLNNSFSWTGLSSVLFMILSFYLLFEAYSSVELLYNTRKLLVNNPQEEAEVEKVKVEDITLKELTDLFK